MQPLSSRGGALIAALAAGVIVALVALAIGLGIDWALVGLWHLPYSLSLGLAVVLGALALAAGAFVGFRAYRLERLPGEV